MAYGNPNPTGYGGGCITGIRFNMSATLLHQNDPYSPGDIDIDQYGTWVDSQDPLTGEIVRVWKQYEDIPSTPEIDEAVTLGTIPCLARGIVDGGIRVAGTTERFGDTYENIDYVKMWLPPHILISKRDRVTNIRDASGRVRWIDEEFIDPRDVPDPGKYATVFNVNGVTPLFSAFNHMVEQFVLLERITVPAEEA